jgi:hypothetical protein
LFLVLYSVDNKIGRRAQTQQPADGVITIVTWVCLGGWLVAVTRIAPAVWGNIQLSCCLLYAAYCVKFHVSGVRC